MVFFKISINPCKCGTKRKPVVSSYDTTKFAVMCNDCKQLQFHPEVCWIRFGAIELWNKENPIKIK